jgi:hypothetical protein
MGSTGSAADDAALAGYASDLVRALDGALAGWVERRVAEVADRWRPGTGAALAAEAAAAGERARAEVVPRLEALLAADVDQQRTGPLDLVRAAVVHPTAVLVAAGVPPADRATTSAAGRSPTISTTWPRRRSPTSTPTWPAPGSPGVRPRPTW